MTRAGSRPAGLTSWSCSISVDALVDLPSAAELGRTVPLMRKQDFGPRMLRRLWAEHGT